MLLLDILVLGGCSFVLIYSRALNSSLHPALTYLGYHFYVVTLRLAALSAGAASSPLFKGALQPVDYVRAAMAFDLLLIASTAAWLTLAHNAHRNRMIFQQRPAWPLLKIRTTLIALPVFAIGIFGLVNFGMAATTKMDFGAWQSSSYLLITAFWSVQALLLLHYLYGFRWYLTITTVIFLILMVFNADRFAVVLPVLFLFYTYISRNNRRWSPKWMVFSIVLLFILWFPLKIIRAGVNSHETASEIVDQTITYDAGAMSMSEKATADELFFDMATGWMIRVDRSGSFSYGREYLPLLTSPIPRAWWPNKPKLNKYESEISTPEYPLAQMGTVPSLAGDSYVNFGYPGVIILGYLIAYFYGFLWQRAAMVSHNTVRRFLYLVLLANLVQVLRDGIGSIVTFTLIVSMPLMIAAAASCLHALLHPQKRWSGGLQPIEMFIYRVSSKTASR